MTLILENYFEKHKKKRIENYYKTFNYFKTFRNTNIVKYYISGLKAALKE